MGAYKTLKHILVDKGITITSLAEQMGKPRQTVANTLYTDNFRVKNLIEYGKMINCDLYLIDNDTGKAYKIEY